MTAAEYLNAPVYWTLDTPGAVVTRRDDITTRYRLIHPAKTVTVTDDLTSTFSFVKRTAILRRVEWDMDEAEWVYPEGSINFYAPDKWDLVVARK